MRRLICAALLTALLVCAAGCAQEPAPTGTTASPSTSLPTETTTPPTDATLPEGATAVYEAPMASVALPLIVQSTKASSGKEIAYYTHQDVSVILPDADVAHAITLDLLNRIDKTSASAQKVLKAAEEDYSGQDNWYPYSYAVTYTPMRLDENILSFLGTEASFDGSPMSIHNAISVSYDLTTGEPLTLRTILHEENYADALCDMILEGLKSKSDQLFADYESIIRAKFSTNVTVSSWYFSNSGLCFYFAPYEIAPYSAGTIISEVPYEKLSGLMKDAYFPGEALDYSGAVKVEKLEDGIPDSYTQFAEIKLQDSKDKLLITTDGSVSNVQLKFTAIPPETGVTETTVLTLAGMGPSDAILLDADAAAVKDQLSITFRSYGETQTLLLKENADGSLVFSK